MNMKLISAIAAIVFYAPIGFADGHTGGHWHVAPHGPNTAIEVTPSGKHRVYTRPGYGYGYNYGCCDPTVGNFAIFGQAIREIRAHRALKRQMEAQQGIQPKVEKPVSSWSEEW